MTADPVRLGQVIGNLLENALRYSRAGDVVTVELTDAPEHVRIVVRDQGPGIAADLRQRVFDRFVRGAGRPGSLGLGLYVARQLVELHGGHIHVDEAVPRGAEFVIELPRSR